uniref:Uncharacterized protein n=1 Tax=Eptatretus burgeri TaxID=7764 RepID=A0A8C4N3J5_EPTBU
MRQNGSNDGIEDVANVQISSTKAVDADSIEPSAHYNFRRSAESHVRLARLKRCWKTKLRQKTGGKEEREEEKKDTEEELTTAAVDKEEVEGLKTILHERGSVLSSSEAGPKRSPCSKQLSQENQTSPKSAWPSPCLFESGSSSASGSSSPSQRTFNRRATFDVIPPTQLPKAVSISPCSFTGPALGKQKACASREQSHKRKTLALGCNFVKRRRALDFETFLSTESSKGDADPNLYTHVILCQLELQEKAIKKAQRWLLHKTQMAGPFMVEESKRHNLRQRHCAGLRSFPEVDSRMEEKEHCDDYDDDYDDDDDVNDDDVDIEPRMSKHEHRYLPESGGSGDRLASQHTVDSMDSQSMPKLLDIDKNILFNVLEKLERSKKKSGEIGKINMESVVANMDSDERGVENIQEQNGEVVDGIEACSTSKDNVIKSDAVVEDIDDEENANIENDVLKIKMAQEAKETPEEEELEKVTCPLCSLPFPMASIELHASTCGLPEPSVQPINSPTRSTWLDQSSRTQDSCLQVAGDDEKQDLVMISPPRQSPVSPQPTSSKAHVMAGQRNERCYICGCLVGQSAYHAHVNLCLQVKSMDTSPVTTRITRKRMHDVDTERHSSRLLGQLTEIEKRQEMSKKGHCNKQHLGWNAVQEITKPNSPVTQPSSSSYRLPPISNSPIKTFIPISEVKNCLVDFKNQFGSSKSKRETLPKVTRIHRRRKVEKSMEDEHMIGKAPLICSLRKDLIPENLQYDKGKSRVTNYVQHIQDQCNG